MFYTIYSNYSDFLHLGFDEDQMERLFGDDHPRYRFDYAVDGISFKDKIKENIIIEFVATRKELKGKLIPDIQILSFHNSGIFLKPKAYEAVKDIIKDDGEFIPVTYEEGEGYIFNPLRMAEDVDGLDKKLCIKNEWGDVENITFHEDRVKNFSVLKTKFDHCNNVYCREDVKLAIEAAKLQGVTFTPELGAKFAMAKNHES